MLPSMRKDRTPPPENGDKLWEVVTKDVTKLKNVEIVPAQGPVKAKEPPKEKKTKPSAKAGVIQAALSPMLTKIAAAKPSGTDRKTDDKIRKGLMEIDAKLDLHGNNAANARKKLLAFVLSSHGKGKRCILLITGKGQGGAQTAEWYESTKGIIRREFRLWLEDPSVRGLILSITEAQPKHGGSGAFYIYLKKNRLT